MIHKKYLVVIALFIILIISVIQKKKANVEGFSFKRTRPKRDRKLESLRQINDKIKSQIKQHKKDIRITKNKEELDNMLIELHEYIGNQNVKNLYYANKDKSNRSYYLQQEGLNNLAKYLKNYND
tara:strand:- start:213 stop:587 length:375 start_codon:yes stop_codon:yes gene_type:complete